MTFLPATKTIARAVAAAVALSALHAVADSEVTSLDKIDVTGYGLGEVRQVETVTAREQAQQVPGASPLEALARFPSVHFESADNQGAYEWSARIGVRGYNQNQLGFTLDGVPLGDMSYGNYNGLHISRAVISENLGRSELSQGSGSLETASSSNLGGTLQFYSIDPSKTAGGFVAQTLGSHYDTRTVLRGETGDTGYGRASFTYAEQSQDKWRQSDSGYQRSAQFNFKYVYEQADNKYTAFYNTSRRREMDYQDLSLNMISQPGGYYYDNTYPNLQQAINIAVNNSCAAAGPAACDYQYYYASGLRNDILTGGTADLSLASNVRLKTTAYYHHNRGNGTYAYPYAPTPGLGGLPISERMSEYSINRYGVTPILTVTYGEHEMKAGAWLETNYAGQARRLYGMYSYYVPSPYVFTGQTESPLPYSGTRDFKYKTDTTMLFVSDNWQATKDLLVSGGFKTLQVKSHEDLVAGDPTVFPNNNDIQAKKDFLPNIGAVYQLGYGAEGFVDYSINMRAFPAAFTNGLSPFASTAAGFALLQNNLRPEVARTIEGGLRYSSPELDGSFALYHAEISDRLVSTAATIAGAGGTILGGPVIIANVGGVKMDGGELAASWRFLPNFSWYNSLSINRTLYQSDYTYGTSTIATGGKHVVDTPNSTIKSIVSFSQAGYFANLGANYTGKRFITYTNDLAVGGYTLFTLSAGYKAPDVSFIKEPTLQLNIDNLTDRKYVGTVGTNGFLNNDPQGLYQTVLTGAPRAFYVTASGKF